MPSQTNPVLPKAGDIFLVKFHPGYGTELRKYRPAVIVSDRVTLADQRFALIAPLTTSTKIFHPRTELTIKRNPALEKDSVLLCWYLWTIDVDRLVRKLGSLSLTDQHKMTEMLRDLF